MMRSIASILVILLMAATGFAQRPTTTISPRDRLMMTDTIRAATARAICALYDRVAAQPLTPNLNVGAYLKHVDLVDEFTKLLRQADQLGGPRWIDEYTCQVQLEISAMRVAYVLRQFAAAYPNRSHITVQQIDRGVRGWSQASFSATGTSTSPIALVRIKPGAGAAWERVSDVDRRRALAAANADATNRAMANAGLILLSDHKTIADSYEIPEVNTAIRSWLGHRPVTDVRFRDDLQVEVSLGVDERDFFNIIRNALDQQKVIALPKQPEDWRRIERDFSSRFQQPVGRAGVERPVPKAPPVALPDRPPEWVEDQINVQGTATGVGPKLKTARQAEAEAIATLRGRIDELKIDKDLTVAAAAKRDPRIAEAISRAIKQSRIYKTEYRADGSVVIHIAANLRDLWEEMLRAVASY
jgi:hypothetical protein